MPSTDVPPPDVTDREVAITHRRWRKPALVAALAVALVFAAVAASPVWEDATHILGGTWLSETREATLRCDVLSGACERIQDGPLRTGPTLGFP